MAKGRQERESIANLYSAPFRKQALYNMYSDKPVHGKRIQARIQQKKFKGNFIDYMERAAKTMNSPRITRQRERVLKKFRDRIQRQ